MIECSIEISNYDIILPHWEHQIIDVGRHHGRIVISYKFITKVGILFINEAYKLEENHSIVVLKRINDLFFEKSLYFDFNTKKTTITYQNDSGKSNKTGSRQEHQFGDNMFL